MRPRRVQQLGHEGRRHEVQLGLAQARAAQVEAAKIPVDQLAILRLHVHPLGVLVDVRLKLDLQQLVLLPPVLRLVAAAGEVDGLAAPLLVPAARVAAVPLHAARILLVELDLDAAHRLGRVEQRAKVARPRRRRLLLEHAQVAAQQAEALVHEVVIARLVLVVGHLAARGELEQLHRRLGPHLRFRVARVGHGGAARWRWRPVGGGLRRRLQAQIRRFPPIRWLGGERWHAGGPRRSRRLAPAPLPASSHRPPATLWGGAAARADWGAVRQRRQHGV